MAEINWLAGWRNPTSYPDESEIPNQLYEALLDNYVRSWLLLVNPRGKKGHTKSRIKELRFDRMTGGRLKATAFLDPEVAEGGHPRGKGINEGFVEHLIPPPPPPPPEKFE